MGLVVGVHGGLYIHAKLVLAGRNVYALRLFDSRMPEQPELLFGNPFELSAQDSAIVHPHGQVGAVDLRVNRNPEFHRTWRQRRPRFGLSDSPRRAI